MKPIQTLALRVGAWYGDRQMTLALPQRWRVTVLAPSTPAPIGDDAIRRAVDHPTGVEPLRFLAAGKTRPLIIVDDLTRPTPTDVVIPHLLRELALAGVDPRQVRILVACGMHGRTPHDAAAKKAGAEAAAACRLIVHDPHAAAAFVGRTSFGTPVFVNREVAASDLVIGVGGVYPQHSVGFGGGSKLLLGVLAQRSIVGLHYGHPSVAGSYDIHNDFRRDLDEMAALARLSFVVSLHVDADRRPVRAVAGDPRSFYEDAVRFARTSFAAEPAGDEHDVVIANAYPMDVSLTFARSKGIAPLAHVGSGASRIFVAACPEGLGLHRLFPYLNGPRFEELVHRVRRLSVVRPSTVPERALRKARHALRRASGRRPARLDATAYQPRQQFAGQVSRAGTIHLWAPLAPGGSLPATIPGLTRAASWEHVVERVEAEHAGGQQILRVAVYPCASLQVLEPAAGLAATEAAAC